MHARRGNPKLKTIDIFGIKQGEGLMTQAFKKMHAISARAQEIELIQTRLAVLSELESTLKRDNTALLAQRAAILQHSFGDGSGRSKIGRAFCRPGAVPLPTKGVYPGLTETS